MIFGWILFFVTPALLSSAFSIGLTGVWSKSVRWLRAGISALCGTVTFGLIILSKSDADTETLLWFGLGLFLIAITVSLPSAWLTLRWLGKRRATREEVETFE